MANPHITVLDGGMGQELFKRGAEKHPYLWGCYALITAPEMVTDAHIAFIEAGAEVITINNYCITPSRLKKADMEADFEKLSVQACRLAHEARDRVGNSNVRIAGALPPLYVSYRPDIPRDFDAMVSEFCRISEVLAPHVDLLLCETMTTAAEAKAATTAAQDSAVPLWLAWTLDDNGKGILRSNETIEDAYHKLESLSIDAFLFNCCAPESITPALQQLKTLTDKPLGAYANAFQPIPADWKSGDADKIGTRKDLNPEQYLSYVDEWIKEGATIIGGCCEITPPHIKAITQRVRG